MSSVSVTAVSVAALSVAVLTTSVAIGAPDVIDRPASASELAVRVDPPDPPPSTTATTIPSGTVPDGFAAELAQVVAITNAERAAVGAGPLTVDPLLTLAAQLHSEDQARMDRLTHTGSDGSDPGDRIARQGYVFRTWGENAAVGYRTAERVMDGWMNSPGHRRNLLNASYTEIGVGVAFAADGTAYWTQVFAAPR